MRQTWTAPVTPEGQVTLPPEVRRLLGIGADETITFVVDDDAIRLIRTAVPPRPAERDNVEQAIVDDVLERLGS